MHSGEIMEISMIDKSYGPHHVHMNIVRIFDLQFQIWYIYNKELKLKSKL